MGREIKFRAWDAQRKTMLSHPKWVHFKHKKDGSIHAENYGYDGNIQKLDLMQYTGLKDANGVEIYEGDIVEYFEVSPNSGGYGKTKRAVVKAEVSELSFLFSVYHGSKVIGNIHQSPELLNDK